MYPNSVVLEEHDVILCNSCHLNKVSIHHILNPLVKVVYSYYLLADGVLADIEKADKNYKDSK